MQGKSFHIITLGCKVNQYESEALREAWLQAGHHELKSPADADLVLINSCAITAKAISDLRAVSRRVRRLTPQGEILVTGCAAEALPEELNTLPVDTLVPQRNKISLLRYLGSAEGFENIELTDSYVFPEHSGREKEEICSGAHEQANESAEFWDYEGPEEIIDKTAFPPFSISDYARTRAVLKIQDGCSQHCTYCIVPKGRGPSTSRPWQAILAEAGRLIYAGFRELVLNGVNLRQYGMDLPVKQDFWDLLTRISAAFAPEWSRRAPDANAYRSLRFRISSLEPGQLNQKALDTLAQSSLIAPHLHLSLQSGSSSILKKMGRGHYNIQKIPDFLENLKQIWPKFGLGADFIVGFPGESEEDFAETIEISEKLPLSYAHVFPYSRRPNTAAASLPGQIPQEIKKERAARLRALISRKKQDFLQSQLKLERVYVVPEEGKKGQGVNEFYSDCRFVGKSVPSGKNIIPVKPVGVDNDTLLIQCC